MKMNSRQTFAEGLAWGTVVVIALLAYYVLPVLLFGDGR
jgi:hypothetical protein